MGSCAGSGGKSWPLATRGDVAVVEVGGALKLRCCFLYSCFGCGGRVLCALVARADLAQGDI